MKIATLVSPQTIEYSEIAEPVPAKGEVLMKISYVGICGSDIHAYYGKHPFVSCPVTMGHEFSGEIEALGEGVTGFAPGDRVTVMPQLVCGECHSCRSGRYNICEHLKVIGCQSQGASCSLFTCPAGLVKKLPDGMPMDLAATVEPVAVGVHALRACGDVRGRNVVVLGAGTIGNLAAQAALSEGAAGVLITDLSDRRLELARSCGVPFTANTAREDLGEAIRAAFGDKGADLFVECVGVGDTVNQAIRLAPKGSEIIVVGVFGARPQVDMGLVQDKELRLVGSLMYLERDFDDAIRWVASGEIKTRPLISAVFPFEQIPEAFRRIQEKPDESMKVLIQVN